MRALSHAELTTIDLHSELRFSVEHRPGWLDRISLTAFAALTFYWAWTRFDVSTHTFSAGVFWPLAPAAMSLVALLINWMQGRSTELRVTNSELVATGNIGRWFTTEVRVPAAEVKSLGFRGGRGGHSGLSVRRGWRYVCLLPGLNAHQAGAVARTIFRRFPKIGSEDRDPGSLLFGKESDLTALGLSNPQHNGRDPGF
jgi:hypothetical protein